MKSNCSAVARGASEEMVGGCYRRSEDDGEESAEEEDERRECRHGEWEGGILGYAI